MAGSPRAPAALPRLPPTPPTPLPSAGLLANLAADPALLVDAASRGAPACLVGVLRSGSAGGAEEALAFLFLDASRSPDRAAFLAALGAVPLAVRALARPGGLSPRGTWLVGLLWSALLPSPDRTVQHELAKARTGFGGEVG